MQRMALFLDLARKRLPVVIVTEHQGLRRGRPPTESTTVVRDGDACDGGELRWGDGSMFTFTEAHARSIDAGVLSKDKPTNEMVATVGRDGDDDGGGERRWGDDSRDTTLDALDDT